MIESLMLIALGFLTATFLALIAVQLVWRRAVTVTTRKLAGDIDLIEAHQNVEKIAHLEAALQDKQSEFTSLSQQHAQLESALAKAVDEAHSLHSEIADLQVQHDAARSEAEIRQQNLVALQSRVDELETAARAEIDRRGLVETQLRSLSEKAARLVHDMNEATAQIADTRGLQSAFATPAPARRMREPQAPVTLAPFPTDDEPHDGELRELAEIKASLSSFSERVHAGFSSGEAGRDEKEADATLPNERFLADRIRALEAGVAP